MCFELLMFCYFGHKLDDKLSIHLESVNLTRSTSEHNKAPFEAKVSKLRSCLKHEHGKLSNLGSILNKKKLTWKSLSARKGVAKAEKLLVPKIHSLRVNFFFIW